MSNLTYKDFVQELKKEVAYHSGNDSDYRRETSRLSMKMATEIREVNIFFDEVKTTNLVNEALHSADLYRRKDVAKMLNMTARSLNAKYKLENDKDAQRYVEQLLGKKIITV